MHLKISIDYTRFSFDLNCSQRNKAVYTPTARAPIDYTPSVHKLSENLDRGSPSRRGGIKSRRLRSFSGLVGGYPGIFQGPRSRLGEDEDEEEEESVEEEESLKTEVTAALVGAPEASEAPNLPLSDKPLVSQAEPNFPNMIKQMTQLLGQLSQEIALREHTSTPAFKTPSMKAPVPCGGT
ncbi:hypothetical protein O181_098641 [Austropuccinia psidii MF-1]|uniref:Uncharacterized protein n=1 Tax=Austropuccinia psidii MF-1 TaxID=1389203 RepID=A0A9Q3JBB3_9BASI|nr:hypothetical protein [Austropuccinia psidii MF-1]